MQYTLILEHEQGLKHGTIVIAAREDDKAPDSYTIIIALVPPDQRATAELIIELLKKSPEAEKTILGL